MKGSKFRRNAKVETTTRVREAKCLELRQAGYNFQAIADVLGVTHTTAMRCYHRALERLPGVENREELRELEAARLDTLLTKRWNAALRGEEPAFGQVMKVLERRAKLLGLDEPAAPNVTIIFKLLSQLKALPESDLLDALGYSGDAGPALPDSGAESADWGPGGAASDRGD